MNKALKELYDRAEERIAGRYDEFLIISDNKAYDGFFGKNGYNSMTLLGFDKSTKTWYKISSRVADVIDSYEPMTWSIDIPTEYNCVRIFFRKPVYIHDTIPLSSVRVFNNKEI